MKSKFLFMFIALGVGLSAFSTPLFAHHGNSAYETDRKITLKGTVTQWVWANPHCILLFDVTDEHGEVAHWSAETENPSSMVHFGYTVHTMKPGDQVTITMLPAKNGTPIGRIVEVVLPSGQKLSGRIPPPGTAADAPKQ